MDFVAIDFETANFSADSACAVGLVKCVGGSVVQTQASLIRPPSLYFSPTCVRVHGLSARDVRNEPTFDILWQNQFRDFVGEMPLVAHNAPFDRGVLYSTLAHYGIAPPPVAWGCTLRMARKLLRKSGAYHQPDCKLNSVAAHFGIRFRHHDALEDSMAVAKIVLEMHMLVGHEGVRKFFS